MVFKEQFQMSYFGFSNASSEEFVFPLVRCINLLKKSSNPFASPDDEIICKRGSTYSVCLLNGYSFGYSQNEHLRSRIK